MTKDAFEELHRAAVKQCPGKAIFLDGTKWTALLESDTWRGRGVDEEIVMDSKTIRCSYEKKEGKWEMTHINDIPIEECIF